MAGPPGAARMACCSSSACRAWACRRADGVGPLPDRQGGPEGVAPVAEGLGGLRGSLARLLPDPPTCMHRESTFLFAIKFRMMFESRNDVPSGSHLVTSRLQWPCHRRPIAMMVSCDLQHGYKCSPSHGSRVRCLLRLTTDFKLRAGMPHALQEELHPLWKAKKKPKYNMHASSQLCTQNNWFTDCRQTHKHGPQSQDKGVLEVVQGCVTRGL
jgi:hypothetical protein